AMACGAPVIATRTGAIPDYAEGAAMLIAPGDRESLWNAIARAVGRASLRAELRAIGPERARSWRWERGASVMNDLLRAI
ncbi:MAG: glycosyltransferase, partial [Thermoanaerobaculia bacterium]